MLVCNKITFILHKVPPPPLHLKLGAVNALMKLLEFLDPEGYKKILAKLHIVKENYHGVSFEGNECSKILRNIRFLKKCVIQFEMCKRIIEALEAFNTFNSACCGIKLKNNWEESIESVKVTWSLLHDRYDVAIPNKVHIIMDHVGDYIQK